MLARCCLADSLNLKPVYSLLASGLEKPPRVHCFRVERGYLGQLQRKWFQTHHFVMRMYLFSFDGRNHPDSQHRAWPFTCSIVDVKEFWIHPVHPHERLQYFFEAVDGDDTGRARFSKALNIRVDFQQRLRRTVALKQGFESPSFWPSWFSVGPLFMIASLNEMQRSSSRPRC